MNARKSIIVLFIKILTKVLLIILTCIIINETKTKDGVFMSIAFAEFAEKLVPVSDFSQGKAGKIFNDVYENNTEYIVLKNNQPTAVVISMQEYKATQEKIARLESFLELMENYRIIAAAKSRTGSATSDFDSFIASEGLDISELKNLMDKVEFD